MASSPGTWTATTFHPFLRVTHVFDSSIHEATATVPGTCLDSLPGDVVLTNIIDPSGWVEATLLRSCNRGWIPAHYCVPYDALPIRSLLIGVLNMVENPRAESGKASQIAVNTIVSGVRSLLDLTDCLTKDSFCVTGSESVRMSRKAFLAEVSALVDLVKNPNVDTNAAVDKNLAQTFKILLNGVIFLDTWASEEQNFMPDLSTLDDHDLPYCDNQQIAAVARLNSVFDGVVFSLGQFMGVDARRPAEVLSITRKAVQSARELITVVEAVNARSSPLSYSLEDAKNSLYEHITDLVTSARDLVAAAADNSDGTKCVCIEEAERVFACATTCVRAAGFCLARAKYVLDRIGDFKLEIDPKPATGTAGSWLLASSSRRSSKSTTTMGSSSSPSNVTDYVEATSFLQSLTPEVSLSRRESDHVKQEKKKPLADRILFNAEGQVQGGSLEALIKYLTSNDATPDALFVSTFFLTFRLFTTPTAFALTLMHRFSSLSPDEPNVLAAQLRVYNAFKGWMESHWHRYQDNEALGIIVEFANGSLKSILPFASVRLLDLAQKVVNTDKPLVPRAMSKLGVNTSLGILLPDSSSVPTPIVNKLHLAMLARFVLEGVPEPNILDFDPLELARQITIKESRLFCKIVPEELLGQEFSKKAGKSNAMNVKAMSSLSTDLANFVGDTILAGNVPLKTRMNYIKHWIRVAEKCLQLKNYNCLMAITCALQSTVILRLKKTWELLPARYHALFAEIKSIIVYEKNYSAYRTVLRNQNPPCIPYLGVYLTDLTFADEGNSDFRSFEFNDDEKPSLSSSVSSASASSSSSSLIINFDKHIRTTKIIADLQRFQVPYRFQEVTEMQTWLDVEVTRVHELYARDQHFFYRRSCVIEPKKQPETTAQTGSDGFIVTASASAT
ncbi:ras guanine nucleotide exchange factor domain-containing protein [Lipomyces japonicus]|uniref:ras guanine nucleotide exchange factor domain-containing protein n=1 Tax=Lipomyces japonicus TaxID=56871 RepID=UPI0034CD1545